MENVIFLYENRNFNSNFELDDERIYVNTVSDLPTPVLAQEEVLKIMYPSQEFANLVYIGDGTRTNVWTRMWSCIKRAIQCIKK